MMQRFRTWFGQQSRLIKGVIVIGVCMVGSTIGFCLLVYASVAFMRTQRPTTTAHLPTAIPSATPLVSTPTSAVTPLPRPTRTPRPTAAPEPTSAPAAIPGILAADVTINLKNQGLTCTGATRMQSGVIMWECRGSWLGADVEVAIYARRFAAIDYISAVVLQTQQDDAIAARILGYVATTPFQYNDVDDSRAWVEGSLPKLKKNQTITRDVHGTTMALFGPPLARTLTLGVFPE